MSASLQAQVDEIGEQMGRQWLREYAAARVSPGQLAYLDSAMADQRLTDRDRLVLVAGVIHADSTGHIRATNADLGAWCNEILDALVEELHGKGRS